jgi:hypothetical protein
MNEKTRTVNSYIGICIVVIIGLGASSIVNTVANSMEIPVAVIHIKHSR